MSTYSIYDNQDQQAPTEKLFVAAQFSWFAALLPPIWAITNGLWIELLVWLIVMAAFAGLSSALGVSALGFFVLSAIFIGLEAHHILGRALQRRGWVHLNEIIAADALVAEANFERHHHASSQSS